MLGQASQLRVRTAFSQDLSIAGGDCVPGAHARAPA